ncbi:cAMP-responsive element modulator-like isoform X2 [Megalops cyprinoides]|uniref:cAMP-responsive element modulator-like isoform X2 n=1 Tax=Megalops cyprinoides TaxID=118141 RepID=UPI0018642772|nr:cAMP-responsive element modulator-like isoform X2 [Megalops cyprinoides]
METLVAPQQVQIQNQSMNSTVSTISQVSRVSSAVNSAQVPGGPAAEAQGVIQAPQPSVIQSSQTYTAQVAAVSENGELADDATDSQRKKMVLSRRPSYRKILNELSSDAPAVPKVEEERGEEERAPSFPAAPSSIIQTGSGQYIAIRQDGAIQLTSPVNEGVQGRPAVAVSSSGVPLPGATILQYAAQSGDAAHPFFIPGSKMVVQAATGDMSAYQIRSSTSSLPQGVMMAVSPGSLHSPQQLAEEATRKRELRLLKNREAARECRRKKKEYVKCLENRVAVLENQNKTLIEELKALKDLYCHKPE